MKKPISNKNTAKQLLKRLDDEVIKVWRDPKTRTLEIVFKNVEKANTYSIPEALIENYANVEVFVQQLITKYKARQIKIKRAKKEANKQ